MIPTAISAADCGIAVVLEAVVVVEARGAGDGDERRAFFGGGVDMVCCAEVWWGAVGCGGVRNRGQA